MCKKGIIGWMLVWMLVMACAPAGADPYGPWSGPQGQAPLGVIRTVDGSRSFVRERADDKSEQVAIVDPNVLFYYYNEQIGSTDRVWYCIFTPYGWGWISSGRAVKVQQYGSSYDGYYSPYSSPYDNGGSNYGSYETPGNGYWVPGAIGPAAGRQGQGRQGCVVIKDGGRSTVRRDASDQVDNIGYVNPGEIHYWYDSKIGTTDAVWYLIFIENPIYPGDNWGWISGKRVVRY